MVNCADHHNSTNFDHNTNKWYDAFFNELKTFYLYGANIAQKEGVEMLILANFSWHDDDNPTSAAYINQKWKDLISEIRQVYPGTITVDYYVDRPQ
ncbi:MAG: glycoside hydrolase family 113 [Candidatus Hadarchaeum sp.]|uniref:glycoside hydrolase family 113 n=1 Tax=Candidatus Hadarchaeum sp. TaxID=2883567 RepID=UPI003D152B6B